MRLAKFMLYGAVGAAAVFIALGAFLAVSAALLRFNDLIGMLFLIIVAGAAIGAAWMQFIDDAHEYERRLNARPRYPTDFGE